MRVEATAVGFDGTDIRNPGDQFEMPDKDGMGKPLKATWFKPVDSKASKASKADEPSTSDQSLT